ncbi:hypothetical protein EB001_22960, partial [bacterium]|nr:hypothetical protein [bacterium]
GGGGCYEGTSGGAGGSGIGGTGGGNSGNGGSGNTNTGSGGGGTFNGTAGSGGSGIVIIAYPTTYSAASSTTGSPTYSSSGGNHIYKFTGSGTITF